MRRLLLIALTLAGAAIAVPTVVLAENESDEQKFTVELDNAFGLIEGADVKVAGVRAGKISAMRLDTRKYRALIDINITEKGFGSLRSDVFCESRPQSLIGEYYLDCLPGTNKKVLKSGSTIPVERTGSTVPVDLVNNIMRRPFRERFSILLSELGVTFAARGSELNETIRRANPALRETDRVLAILAQQRNVIRDLIKNADTVLVELSNNRRDVSRFIQEARDTSKASSERAPDIARQFRRLPTFLRELRLTMGELGHVADAQIPALRNLNRSAPHLTAFFNTLGPFADASRPSFRTLAVAARAGRPALDAANPRISELRQFAAQAPELATNLTYVLEDLDDPDRTVEQDPRAPAGQRGYSGLQAILQYVFNQSQAINLFDANGYMLKASPFVDRDCANYTNAEQARNPATERCRAKLGPNQPGINQPDPSYGSPSGPTAASAARARASAQDAQILERSRDAAGPAPTAGSSQSAPSPARRRAPKSVADTLGAVLGGRLPSAPLPGGVVPQGTAPRTADPAGGPEAGLLDFLLAP